MITVEQTPNPNALKFITKRAVMGERAPKFFKKETDYDDDTSPVAYTLFRIHGIEDVFLGSDFITVGKDPTVEWPLLKQPIIDIINDYDQMGDPWLIEDKKEWEVENIDLEAGSQNIDLEAGDKVNIEKQIIQLLDQRVRPAVAQDGGDIILHSFKDGVVYLEMFGACNGCPSSTATLKMGIENMLRHYIPEVNRVEAING